MIDVRDDLATALAGRYEIERELGHGGMAIVYLARDVRHDRHVAVKALRPELATTLGAERFLREINIAARLTHPNILALHDSGVAGGMLYFVMPHVDGESLRDRLDREHQLPMDEALAITRQIGLALDYAHERGIVHRDIKPENILLLGDHVLVADFGLARALYTAGTHRLTESAVAVGTPAYMSPEQAAADPDVDGRSDLYSLACVLFEMIAGMPPFKGATSAAVLAQHLTAKPPSICAQRPHCPPDVDAAVARALEKTPADRFRTAGEFVAALTGTSLPAGGSTPGGNAAARTAASVRRSRRRVVAWSSGGAVIVAAAVAWRVVVPASHPRLDATSFVVVPLVAIDAAARADTAAVTRGIADALGEWDGVHVVDTREIADEVGSSHRSGPLRVGDALDIARKFGAANMVWGEVSANPGDSDDQMTARFRLYDVATGKVVRPASIDYARGGWSTSRQRTAASTLLRGQRELPHQPADGAYHPSLAAWTAYDSGRASLARWEVAEAASHFRAALAIDPTHAEANLWLSVASMWQGHPGDDWRTAARQANERRGQLDPRERDLAVAQLALAEGRFPDACAAYARVVAEDSGGVAGRFGLGECESRDSIVVPDARSPSRWRFRGSVNHAIASYMRIVDEQPPPQPTFVYTRLSQLLYTSGIQLKPGHSLAPARIEFGAYPTLDADTLAFVPYPLDSATAPAGPPSPGAKARALDHNRALLRRLYRSAAANIPTTAEAHTALATLLEAIEEIDGNGNGQLSALAEIRRARALSSGGVQRLLLARAELRMLVKAGEWQRAAAFADSLFRANRESAADTNAILAGAAALTGRIGVLATLLRAEESAPTFSYAMPNGAPVDVPPALRGDAAATFASALSGACTATLRSYPERLQQQLPSYVPDPQSRSRVGGVLLRRALAVAMPCVGPASLLGIDPSADKLVMLEQAIARRDAASFHRVYDAMEKVRSRDRPGDISMDYVYMESWMLAALGDTAGAIAHLDRSLKALPTLGAYLLDFPSHSAALVRAMGLRAELASAQHDRPTTARWAAAVAAIWVHADPELQSYVRSLCALDGAHCGVAPPASRER